MGGSRRKLKRSRPKVRVSLPKKNPHVYKPAFCIPPKLRSLIQQHDKDPEWDNKASVIHNYKSFGFVSNPNLLSVRSRTYEIIENDSLQNPPSLLSDQADIELALADSGSDLEEDDLKSAIGKRRKDGKSGTLQPLTTMQRHYIGKMIEKYGDDYERMFMDIKLNALQHSKATLEKLCQRFSMFQNRKPLILGV